MTIWTVKPCKPLPGAIEQMCRRFKLTPLGAEVMLAKGFNNAALIEYFKNADINNLHSLTDIPQVQRAFSLILSAINKKLPIVIYGDYDVDGVTSTVILCKGLRAIGGMVDYFIPDRHTDGYGLNPQAIRNIAEGGCKLLITCDNGIAAKNEVAYARQLGMQVIILDHHEPAFEMINDEKHYILPEAEAMVDMKLEAIDYPFRELCAGGLCYKFIRDFFSYLNKPFYLDDELIVFAALATVCDVVPLVDENRIIAKRGIEIINKQKDNMGLRMLIEINELTKKPITEYTFGFIIGPCINAGGRLEVAALAAELFMCEDASKGQELAERLYELNSIRKEMTRQSFEALAEKADNISDKVLVLYDEAIDESIAGIVAGRLKEKYYKPTIVLTKSGDGAKGSGRSIDGYDMFNALSQYRELFTKFGGHKAAAGMSLPIENIQPLTKGLNESCTLTEKDMEPVLSAEVIVNMGEISINAAQDMEMFKPYGNGNPEPLLGAVGLRIVKLRFVGADKSIAQLSLRDSSQNNVAAVCFDGEYLAEVINSHYGYTYIDEDRNNTVVPEDIKVDIMANLRIDTYMGNEKPKLIIKDIRVSKL